MSSELDAALSAAGRAGAMVLDSYSVDLHTDDDLADLARAVLESLGLTVTGEREWRCVVDDGASPYYDIEAGVRRHARRWRGTVQRRRTVESAWEDVT